jgi:hypothetical protein
MYCTLRCLKMHGRPPAVSRHSSCKALVLATQVRQIQYSQMWLTGPKQIQHRYHGITGSDPLVGAPQTMTDETIHCRTTSIPGKMGLRARPARCGEILRMRMPAQHVKMDNDPEQPLILNRTGTSLSL